MGTVAGRMNPGNGTPPMSDTAVTATKIRSSAVIARAATRTALTRRPVASTNTGDAAIVTVDKVFPHVLRISSDSPGVHTRRSARRFGRVSNLSANANLAGDEPGLGLAP
jgi:hypothetical protein